MVAVRNQRRQKNWASLFLCDLTGLGRSPILDVWGPSLENRATISLQNQKSPGDDLNRRGSLLAEEMRYFLGIRLKPALS
jgi:hypothetical protein